MKNLDIKTKIWLFMSLIIAVGIGIILFYKPKSVYEVVILGDSNIGNFRDETGVAYITEENINGDHQIRVFNGGFGGSSAVSQNEASFINLADAIANKEFSQTLAKAAAREDGDLTYFDDSLRALSEVDFNRVQILVLAYGTNDYLLGVDKETYCQAMKIGIDKIKASYPNLKILLVTPFYNEGKAIDTSKNIADYSQIIREECSEYSIFDAYNEGIVNSDNINERTLDGVHLNPEARAIYGKRLAEEISKLYRQ